MENKQIGHSFEKGAFIITLGMLAVKFFGAFFKVPLMSILGGEGSAYFTGAYDLYNPIYALSTAGLPIAISRVVSENVALNRFRDVRKIRRVSVPIFFITGSIGFIFIIIGAFVYSKLSKTPDSIYSTFMLAPTLLFSCLMSSYRGYYEGLRNMTPTAVSEVIESVGKCVFGLSLSYLTLFVGRKEYESNGTLFGIHYDRITADGKLLSFASASSILGVAISSFLGFMYMYLRYRTKGDNISIEMIQNSPKPKSFSKILRSILKVAIPIGLGAIIMNLSGVIDSVLVKRRLYDISNRSIDDLLNVYGALIPQDVIHRGNIHVFLSGCFGYTSTIAMFIPTISQGISISTLPMMTAAWTLKDNRKVKKNVEKILKISSIISIPMGLGLSSLSFQIMDLIYNTLHKGEHLSEVIVGSQIMSIFGIGAIFISLSTPICSMLQAIGRADLPVKILSFGMIIKIILNYILVGIPRFNIRGACIGTLVCYIFIFVCSLFALCKNAKIKINLGKSFLKPFLSGIICAISSKLFYNMFSILLSNKISTIFSIVSSAIVYIIFIFLFKSVTEDDLKSTRIAKKFLKVFKKFKFV